MIDLSVSISLSDDHSARLQLRSRTQHFSRDKTRAMGTYSPAAFPRRPKNSNIFSEAYYQWQLAYYRYEVNTGLYVMSTAEKAAFNLVVFSLLALCLAFTYYCLPRAAIEALQRLAYYLTGYYKMPTAITAPIPHLAQRVLQRSGEAVASLGHDGGTAALNASKALMP